MEREGIAASFKEGFRLVFTLLVTGGFFFSCAPSDSSAGKEKKMTQWELLLFFSHEPLGNGQLKRYRAEQEREEE